MTPDIRMRRVFLLAFFGYVILDLACPLVPGAFSFDPAHSVEAVSAWRARPPALARVAPAPPAMTSEPLRGEMPGHAVAAPPVTPVVVWRPHAGRDDFRTRDARPSVDDD